MIKVGEGEKAVELSDSLLKNYQATFPKKYYMEILNNKIAGLIRKNESKAAIENSFVLLNIAVVPEVTNVLTIVGERVVDPPVKFINRAEAVNGVYRSFKSGWSY